MGEDEQVVIDNETLVEPEVENPVDTTPSTPEVVYPIGIYDMLAQFQSDESLDVVMEHLRAEDEEKDHIKIMVQGVIGYMYSYINDQKGRQYDKYRRDMWFQAFLMEVTQYYTHADGEGASGNVRATSKGITSERFTGLQALFDTLRTPHLLGINDEDLDEVEL